MRRRTGFTIVETMLAIVIVSIMSVIAYPKLRNSIIKSNLRGARTQVANMLAAARATSAQGGRKTWLKFNGNVAVVTASPRRKAPLTGNTEDTIGTAINLSTVYGATASLNNGYTQVAYDARGLASLPGSVKISLTRSGYTDSVLVDMLGRVRK